MSGKKTPLMWMKSFGFEESNMNFQAAWAIGQTYDRQGDIAEVLQTCALIENGNVESWFTEWKKTADRVYTAALESEKRGHMVSAGETFQKASNYYRTAEFYLHEDPADPRALGTAKKAVDCFQKAMKYREIPVECVRIPYEDTTLPAYFYTSPKAADRAPLLVVQTGFDGTAEELYGTADAAMKRGYHCLIFEGPGQGQALRAQNLIFRHDWEKVMTPVIDYAVSREEVDGEKIAVIGFSFGGWLVPRAACFEYRPKVYIANPGGYDFSETAGGFFSPEMVEMMKNDPDRFNTLIMEYAKKSVALHFGITDGLWKFGCSKPSEFFNVIEQYKLTKQDLAKIRSHMVITDCEGEEIVDAGQPKKLYDMLKENKDYMMFTVEEAAEVHCQIGALSVLYQKTFDWLDEFFEK